LAQWQLGLPQVTRILVKEPSTKGLALVKFFIAAFRLAFRTLIDIPFSSLISTSVYDFKIIRIYTYNILNKKIKREEHFFRKKDFSGKINTKKV